MTADHVVAGMSNWKRAAAVAGVGLVLCSFSITAAHADDAEPVTSAAAWARAEVALTPSCDMFGDDDGSQSILGVIITGLYPVFEGHTVFEIHGNSAEGMIDGFGPADGRPFTNYTRYVPGGPAEQTVWVQVSTVAPGAVIVDTVTANVVLTPDTFGSCATPDTPVAPTPSEPSAPSTPAPAGSSTPSKPTAPAPPITLPVTL